MIAEVTCQFLGEKKGHFKRLFGIEARIAESLVTSCQIGLGEALGTAHTFGHVLTRHLDMNATRT